MSIHPKRVFFLKISIKKEKGNHYDYISSQDLPNSSRCDL